LLMSFVITEFAYLFGFGYLDKVVL
jgi:hypothetical protein